MVYNQSLHVEAKLYRSKGYSLSEISKRFKISKSTASLWTSKEIITSEGEKRIAIKQVSARKKGIATIKRRREIMFREIRLLTKAALKPIEITPALAKLLCSIFIWTEGGKSNMNRVVLVNSDPLMVSTFLFLLRKSFVLDESKLRALVHLHEYHEEQEILKFWVKKTDIPLTQFTKSYLKSNTKKRIRTGYKGCIRICYYDYKIARELFTIYNMFAHSLGV